jgi:hypothetical protein
MVHFFPLQKDLFEVPRFIRTAWINLGNQIKNGNHYIHASGF